MLYNTIMRAVSALKARSGLRTLKTHTFYQPLVKNNVIDLGANVGEFSLALVNSTNATCYAVEPIATNYTQIPEHPKIRKHKIAVGDKKGEVLIFISNNRECNSIHRPIAFDYGLAGDEICETLTLEQFLQLEGIKSVDLLKIDIEGAEELVFSSTSDDTLRRIGQITIEFHDFIPGSISSVTVGHITDRLKMLGFEWLPLSYLNPLAPTADVLFVQTTKCSLLHRVYFYPLRWLLLLEHLKQHLRGSLVSS